MPTNNVDKTLGVINQDFESSKSEFKTSDSILIETTIKEQEIRTLEYKKRDELYTCLLKSYIDEYNKKSKSKKRYKLIFFIIIAVSFVLINIAFIASVMVAIFSESSSILNVGVIISSVTGLISAIIVLPKVIAEHLFPSNEDDHMINLVKNMQLNDTSIRKENK